MKTCIICGNLIEENETTCSRCGYSVNQTFTPSDDSQPETPEQALFEVEHTSDSENNSEDESVQEHIESKKPEAQKTALRHTTPKKPAQTESNPKQSSSKMIPAIIAVVVIIAIAVVIFIRKNSSSDKANNKTSSAPTTAAVTANDFDEPAIAIAKAAISYDYDTLSTSYAFDFDTAVSESSNGNMDDSTFGALHDDFTSTYGEDFTIDATVNSSEELDKTAFSSVISENKDTFLKSLTDVDTGITEDKVDSLAKVNLTLSIKGSSDSDTENIEIYLVKLNYSSSWSALLIKTE